jgi:energy-coupling factor transport system permease protein
LIAGLLVALSGWVLTFWLDWLGWVLVLGGVLSIIFLTVRLGRQVPRTYYRRRLWLARDSGLAISVLPPLLLVFIEMPFVDRSTLNYMPYPSLSFPPFDPFIGLALISLALPAALAAIVERT